LSILLAPAQANAHRLDEYLQDTTFLIEKTQLTAWIRLTPGSAVLPQILPQIDTNSDGLISPQEQSAYAQRVLKDLTLTLDNHPLQLRLASCSFPPTNAMKEGEGEILLVFTADLPHPTRSPRHLAFENHHHPDLGAYLVNALIPDDPDIHIQSQSRNYNQSHYALTYTQPLQPPVAAAQPTTFPHALTASAIAATVVLLASLTLLRLKRTLNATTKVAPLKSQDKSNPTWIALRMPQEDRFYSSRPNSEYYEHLLGKRD